MIDDWREKWYNGTSNQTTPFYFGFAQVGISVYMTLYIFPFKDVLGGGRVNFFIVMSKSLAQC